MTNETTPHLWADPKNLPESIVRKQTPNHAYIDQFRGMTYNERLILIGKVREADEHFNVKAAPLVMPIIVIALGIAVAEAAGSDAGVFAGSLFIAGFLAVVAVLMRISRREESLYEGWKFILEDVHKTTTAFEQKSESSVVTTPASSASATQLTGQPAA